MGFTGGAAFIRKKRSLLYLSIQFGFGHMRPAFGVKLTSPGGAADPPYLATSLGAGEAASFWKRGSFLSGSNIGSSRSSAGVSGAASAPSCGIECSFSKAAMARFYLDFTQVMQVRLPVLVFFQILGHVL